MAEDFPLEGRRKNRIIPPLALSLFVSHPLLFFRFIFDLLDHQFTRDFYPLSRFGRRKKVFWNGKFDGDIYNGKDLFPNAVDIIRDLFSLVIILSREDLYHYVMQNVYDYNFKEKERECLIGKSN